MLEEGVREWKMMKEFQAWGFFQFSYQWVSPCATSWAWQSLFSYASFCVTGSGVICKFSPFYVGKDFNQRVWNQKEKKVGQKFELWFWPQHFSRQWLKIRYRKTCYYFSRPQLFHGSRRTWRVGAQTKPHGTLKWHRIAKETLNS